MYGVDRLSRGYREFSRGQYGKLYGKVRTNSKVYTQYDIILLGVIQNARGTVCEAEFSYDGNAWYMDGSGRVYRKTIDPKKPRRRINLCKFAYITFKRGR